MDQMVFWLLVLLVVVAVILWWRRIVLFLAHRAPFLAGWPFVGSIFQSEDSRLSIIKDSIQEDQEKRLERRKTACEKRASFSAVRACAEREFFKSDPYVSFTEEEKTRDLLAKRVLKNGLSSHSKLAPQAAPNSIKRVHLETLGFYAHRFQTEEVYREPFELTYFDDLQGKFKESTVDDLVARLRKRTLAPTLLFLTGSIGSGKSTLATIVQATLLRETATQKKQARDRVVPVDFETVLTLSSKKNSEISTDLLAQYVMSEIRKQYDGIQENNLAEHLAKSTHRYIFIFDNLDLAYAEFCKHFVEGDQDVQGVIGATNYLTCLKHLVHVFQSVNRKSALATPSALFCLRDDTFILLDKVTEKIGEPGLKEQHNMYSLASPLPDSSTRHFSAIVKKRGRLIGQFLSDAGEETLAKSAEQWFSAFPDNGSVSFRRYVNLSVQGMRTAIHSLNKYASASSAPSSLVFAALSDGFRAEVLGFFNGQQYYSQNESNIANIFLVNTEYRNSSETAVVPSGLSILPYFHEHSFWLKYLIFSYIAATSNYGRGATLFEEIRRIFSNIGGFPEDLVSLVVYSLTEIQHGRLVRPKSNENARLVTLTSRGCEFAANHMDVAWSTSYLATILEDEWLELPQSLYQKTKVFGTNAFWDKESFCEYTVNKVDVVRDFLICLEATFEFEKKARPKLFAELDKVEGLSTLLPRFKELHERQFAAFEGIGYTQDQKCRERLFERIREVRDKQYSFQRIQELKKELEPLYDFEV